MIRFDQQLTAMLGANAAGKTGCQAVLRLYSIIGDQRRICPEDFMSQTTRARSRAGHSGPQGPTLCFQYLGAHLLDDRLITPSSAYDDTPIWYHTAAVSARPPTSGRGVRGTDAGSPYAALARAEGPGRATARLPSHRVTRAFVRSDRHVRFGGRPRETDSEQPGHCARGRPYNLTYAHGPTAPPEAVPKPKAATPAAQLKADTALVNQLRNAVEAASDDDGWAPLASVGNIITKQRPDFDSRNYGNAKLSDLITATTLFELDPRSPGDGKSAVIYARDKRRRPDE
ncbi:OST-HTH/LOTUS domain-containing protein [Amycolatopsis sp. cmx-11-51]|uniref:OST-HTH/LOTUS domain-containing protein n=1 Tax=Amycolatopsis sp. cmx-11-51 TaxID=2785797 RepID=UPI0039E48B39